MVLYCLIWPFMDFYGLLWPYYCVLWPFMAKYRSDWTCTVLSCGHRSKFIWSCYKSKLTYEILHFWWLSSYWICLKNWLAIKAWGAFIYQKLSHLPFAHTSMSNASKLNQCTVVNIRVRPPWRNISLIDNGRGFLLSLSLITHYRISILNRSYFPQLWTNLFFKGLQNFVRGIKNAFRLEQRQMLR